ncbi:alpha/beta-hydrolase [Polychaeton citri CBS 116435]|uniref:Alpha/beta-hydrolase n=1 Tax=Polychaeton citri CBS 116435 TaxID=1314669 RepID=A0A9P4Q474_9PEZI|nr:alpha/beta-hydrolase [Polychaeton citri CBS 116435]
MARTLDKITPNDDRVKSQCVVVNGWRWHYLDASPEGPARGVVVLVHGFPDVALAWRYQIPVLTSLGLRCIAIDCMGYGGTGASDKLSDYSFKSHAIAIAAIAKQIGASKIILGGHDWGGVVVYRTAQWYPDLVSHVFSVATPYFPISDQFIPAEVLAAKMPQFGYQLQLGSEEQKVEKAAGTKSQIRRLLNAVYNGKPASGTRAVTPEKGVDLDLIVSDEVIHPSPFFDDVELDFYAEQFAKHGMHGPCNWYRTRKVNFDEEMEMAPERQKGLSQPTLFIQCLHDDILTPSLSVGMEDCIPHLTRAEVAASHWGLWHTAAETNDHIKTWVEGVVFGSKSKI